LATKKKPAAKSARTKRTQAVAKKKVVSKKASPKKRPPKAQSASTKRKTSKTVAAKSVKSNKSKKSAKQRVKADRTTQAGKGDELVKVDRRRSAGRRKEAACDTAKGSKQPKLERRKKVQRRRQIDPTTCERDYSLGEVEFMSALDDYKRKSGRMFPTCSEILEVIRELGYVKLSDAEITARNSSQQLESDTVGSEDFSEHREAEDLEELEAVVPFEVEESETKGQNLPWTI
jgi:hypothetical protein